MRAKKSFTHLSTLKRSASEDQRWYLGDGEGIEDGEEIRDEVVPGGVLRLCWLAGEAVATEVRGDGLESCFGDGDHLVPPRVPYLGKSMDEEDGPQFPCVLTHTRQVGKEEGE